MNGFPWSCGRALVRWVFALALGAGTLTAPAGFADEPDLSPVLVEMVDGVIIPAYADFAAKADEEVLAVAALCNDPGENGLAAAREGFGLLVDGFSRVEALRVGPAREGNRFEKLFFWPDRRGRGLRQVEGLIRQRDPTALDADQLAGKSVAVQGLLALDFALSDDEAESALLQKGNYRCAYALALSRRIAATAHELHADWSGPAGYGNQMKNAGPDQLVYRSSGEAMQEILRAASEMLTIDRDFKIAGVIGGNRKETKVKKAPFWRSGLWLRAVDGNIAFVEALFAGDTLAAKLGDQNETLPKELRFELEQARKAVAKASGLPANDRDVAGFSEEAYGLLSYASAPLHGAADIVESRLPQALGLVLGFNSLDGD